MNTSRPPIDSLFGADAQETPAALAAALAPPAAAGHFDELRGAPSQGSSTARHGAPHGLPARPWARFFENLGSDGFDDLHRRGAALQRQLHDNGVTYNAYADPRSPQRPWSLDLFPLIVSASSWRRIEAGVLQRMQLLDRVLADVYGAQRLLASNLLPPALVHGHPGYLRPMHGAVPAGGTYLHIAAFDLAHGPDGNWCVLSQRTQGASGLGYLLENRIAVSRLFPDAFRVLKVQRLAGTYRALVDGLRAMAPGGGDARIVLLTPGPHHETYFEHAYLARFLGLALVEGADLTARDQRLWLKTLRGLEPVHAVITRLDDEFLDPLELRADSRLGVPGLVQAARAGNVLVANTPGSALLESAALLGFLPALARHLLGEDLKLASVATWWCGERAALDAMLPQLAGCLIKPTYGGAGAGTVSGRSLSARELDEWAGRLQRDPDRHTVQEWLPLSQMPTWRQDPQGGRIVPRSLILRVFAVCDGPGSWRVLPGGLTRLAAPGLEIASMLRGGSSADTWVLADGAVEHAATVAFPLAQTQPRGPHSTTSRAAESLFWLGRYTERTENTARLARLALEALTGEDQTSQPLLAWLGRMATANGLVAPDVAPPTQARRVFERTLLAALGDRAHATSVGFNLAQLQRAASGVRERLSQEHWNAIVRAGEDFAQGCAAHAGPAGGSPLDALPLLEAVSGATAAITGAQVDRMARDDGWQLLSAGRHLERLAFLASALATALDTGVLAGEPGFESVVALFGSTVGFHAQYQQRHDLPALAALLVLDRADPRSLAWVALSLRARLAKLATAVGGDDSDLADLVPDPRDWPAAATLCAGDAGALRTLLGDCVAGAYRLSDALSARYFAHAQGAPHSVGT